MVKTRSSALPSSSSSAQKPPCSSSHSSSSSAAAPPPPPRKSRRRRTVAMPARKRKLRRQRALQKQVAIAKASPSVVARETGKNFTKSTRNPASEQPAFFSEPSDKLDANPKAACKTSARQGFHINRNECNRSFRASKKRALGTMDKERNPDSTEKCTKAKEKQNHDAVCQATCKKVRISEAADACIGECDHDQLKEVNHGNRWTSEQDLALQEAYFQVRPSSNFWFEVSKKVPGKTANDCFDRFYSAHPTPPTTQPRSRKLAAETPVRTISFSSPMSSLNSKVRFGRGKQGLLKAHQTVRHILRQRRVADGTYEADVFSTVEQFSARNSLLQDCTNRAISPLPALDGNNPSSESLIGTPMSSFGAAKSESELWWSVSSKQNSRHGHDENAYTTRSTAKRELLSPEVLKAERNPGRLDRFLDILHLRRVDKRKNSSTKGVSQDSQGNPKAERTFTQSIAAARQAIISDATEVLKATRQEKATVAEEETGFLTGFLLDDLEEEEPLLMLDD